MQPTLEHNHARYDELNRLSTMSSPADASGCTGLSWTYDAWANRTNQTTSSGACTESHPTIGANNQFTGAPYTYDAAGNMTADGNHTYTYDAENRLTTVDGGATATYVYDAEGQRVLKTTGGVTTAYLYDPAGNVIAETNGGDTLNIGYAYAGSQLVAEYEGGTTLFVHKDHLGSTRVMTTMNGTVADSMDYLPYGEQIAGGSTTTHKFTGKERDAESGLDDFGARYYSSTVGRFASVDPHLADAQRLLDPQQLNMYGYARDNPLRFGDSDGKDVKETIKSNTYDVQGATADEALNNATKTSGIKTETGEDMSGKTTASMSIKYKDVEVSQTSPTIATDGTAFTEIKSSDVILVQTITLPKWDGYDNASKEEKTEWDSKVATLKEHEEGHATINREEASKLDKSLPGTTGYGTGKTPQQALNAAYGQMGQQVQKKLNNTQKDTKQRNQDYDKATDHGRKPKHLQ
jgi:RHS repeat-associated protein